MEKRNTKFQSMVPLNIRMACNLYKLVHVLLDISIVLNFLLSKNILCI